MNLAHLAVRRPVTTTMLLVSVLVVGGIAAVRLPLAYLPEVDVPFIGIQIPYPNSTPEQVEREIAKPVEEVLATLSGVKKLNSRSDADGAEFFLEFDWGQTLDIVRMEVSEKIDQVKGELPASIGEILIFSFNTSDIPVVQARISAEGVDLASNYDLIETRIVNRLRRLPGVARVDLEGVEPREIHIDLVLDKVKLHRVDVGALIGRLQGASSNLVLGQVEDGGLRFTARALGAYASVEEVGNLVVDERGLRLADIAEIEYEQPPIPYGRHLDRKYAVALLVYKESTANTVEVVRAVQGTLAEVGQDPLLQGINLFVWEDQGEIITNSIWGLLSSGVIGSLLAVACLYLFLRRFDSTFIVSLSIPFSVVAACGVLYFMGGSLNILSMMGLMLAVGMLVDNAVVVLEAIDRRHRTEPDREAAALDGARQVAVAVATSTLTTVIVFLPLLVGAKTDIATWLKEIGVAITIALACSLVTAMTLIPLTAAHILGHRKTRPVPYIERLEEIYVRALAWTLRHRAKTGALVAGALVVGLLPFFTGWVDAAMFSGTRNERLFMMFEFADFTFKAEAERAVDAVEDFLEPRRAEYGIESIYSYYTENEGQMTLTLARKNLSDEEFKDLRERIRKELPTQAGVRVVFDEDSESGGSSTYFAVRFFGQDTAVLEGLATEAERRLATVEGVHDVRTPFRMARREVHVTVDREKARRAGLSAKDVADIFSFTLGSMRLPRFNAGEREVETWLALRLEDRENLEDLRQIQIGGGEDGQRPVLLGDIAHFEIVPRPKEIVRENRKVTVAVRATYDGEEWEEAKEEIEGLMDAFSLPGGYSWGWNDRIVEQQDNSQQMMVNLLLALALVYIVMASLFESLAQPFAILFSIPFALPGVAWGLALTGTTFNLMAQIGILILMGVVVNNGIVLLDRLNQLRKAGMPRDQAVLEAGRERLRPILMTALTTVVGLLPLAVPGPNAAGIFYYPLARTVMGGLLSSLGLTLLVLPYVTIGVEGVAAWGRRLWRSSRPAAAAAAAPPEPAVP